MIVIVLCCNMICGCLTTDNHQIQCPMNWDGATARFVEICNPEKPNEIGLECECMNLRMQK